jgi:hypothetical protein
MITISHDRARFTLKPEKAEGARTLLVLIDKTAGQQGAKRVREKVNPLDNSNKRDYPAFYAGMATADYINDYNAVNHRKKLLKLEFTFANRLAPILDATIEEVCEEPNPDYIAPAYVAPVAKAKRSNALRDAVLACLPDLEHYAATHGAGPDKRLAALLEALK